MEALNDTTYRTTHETLDIIVGDEKQAKFFPRVKLKRWGNEVNFSVGLKHQGGRHKQVGNKITYNAGNMKAEFYPTRAQTDTIRKEDQKGFEFSITLDHRPASNVIPLTIQTKGLTFHYQPPLTKAEKKTSTRPENVEGSYAVYHESKANNDYQTGKAFHIFRPWAEDTTGKRVWCELNIDTDDNGRAKKDEITLTIPQDFLDEASYPVLVDPTFGYFAAGASSTTAANKILMLASQTSMAGTVGAILSYCTVASTGGTVRLQFALYNSGSGDLIGLSIEATYTSNQSANWRGCNSLIYSAAGIYDVALWSNNPSAPEEILVNYDTLTNAGKNKSETYASFGWADPIASTSTDNNRYSIYAIYTSSAIQRATTQDASNTSATTSVTANYASTPTPGNLLIAGVTSNRPNGTNAISGWTLVKECQASGNVNSGSIFAKIAGTGESTSVQATASGAGVMNIAIFEYAGAFLPTGTTVAALTETTNSTDNIAASTGGSNTNTSVTVGATNDLLIAVSVNGGGNASAHDWSASGFTNLFTTGTRLSVADRIVANTTSNTYTASLTWTTSRASGVAVAAFKVAPAKPISTLGAG